MSRFIVPLADVIVANGATDSAAVVANSDNGFRDADALTFFAPTTLPETATLQVAQTVTPSAGDWVTLNDGTNDFGVAAAKARTLLGPTFLAFRIHLSVAAAAQRTFRVNKGFIARSL